MTARVLKFWTDGFVVWVLLFSALAWFFPEPFQALKPAIVPGLGVIMFGMGMSLLPEDFSRVVRQPTAVACGVVGQFLFMPFIAWMIAFAFGLPPELQLGFVILGACPGGTASNVIVYLARGNVALSVTMTACSTIVAVFLTPLLVKLYGSEAIPVDALALFKSVLTIVLLPVSAGLGMHMLLGKRAERVNAVFPSLSVLIIVLVIAAIVGLSHETLPQVGLLLAAAVFVHNGLGLALGYGMARVLKLSPEDRRTVAIEVGMQNSGLGVALATQHFSAMPIVALPSSVFSVAHNITGSLLASYWRRGKGGGTTTDSGSNEGEM